jgi:hypothetical protein
VYLISITDLAGDRMVQQIMRNTLTDHKVKEIMQREKSVPGLSVALFDTEDATGCEIHSLDCLTRKVWSAKGVPTDYGVFILFPAKVA